MSIFHSVLRLVSFEGWWLRLHYFFLRDGNLTVVQNPHELRKVGNAAPTPEGVLCCRPLCTPAGRDRALYVSATFGNSSHSSSDVPVYCATCGSIRLIWLRNQPPRASSISSCVPQR